MTLQETAHEILADGRGILAADDSTGTITKRFEAAGISSTEETRRRYRDLLVTTRDVEQYLGGVILYDETVRQDALDGTSMVETLRLHRTIPAAVPGIVFLSGGQDDEQATANLDAIARRGPQPWTVSFSYARALQGRPMSVWAGAEENVAAAQDAFAERLRLTGAANRGEWSSGRAA